MKVLYCNPRFWDYRLPYFTCLNKLFGSFSVIYSTKRYCGREKLLEQIPKTLGKHAIPYENEPMFDITTRSFSKFTENGKQIPMPFGLLSQIRKQKPDILRTEGFFQWTPWVLLYSLFHHTPVFMGYERTLWTERNTGKLKTWHRKLTDKFITGYLVNGVETQSYLQSIGIKKEKIIITGMSADGSGLRAGIKAMTDEEKKDMIAKYKTNKGIMYLFCGALIKRKGVEPMLAAWIEHIKKHPKDTLVLIGGGELHDKIISMYANEYSIFIEGRKEYQDVCKYYGIADVFILPTIEDNWSLVVPEAMSCGLPIATSIYNGCYPELVQEGKNGCTFDTFNQKSLLSALDYFHHIDLKEFGKKSKEIEKEYSTEKCAMREYEGIKKLLENKINNGLFIK